MVFNGLHIFHISHIKKLAVVEKHLLYTTLFVYMYLPLSLNLHEVYCPDDLTNNHHALSSDYISVMATSQVGQVELSCTFSGAKSTHGCLEREYEKTSNIPVKCC